jgi:uncharacterized protein (TIGR02996 family)
MTHDEAFVQAILEEPDDDTHRLIYSDWLEERGDPRGEFIRTQVQLARMAADDPLRPEFESREWELLRQHRKEWLGPLARASCQCIFQRGFAERLRFDTPAVEDFLAIAPALGQLPTLRHLTFPCRRLDAASAQLLADSPALGQFRTLELPGVINPDALRVLLHSPHLIRLTSLGLIGGNYWGEQGMRVLLDSPVLPQLVSLDLSGVSNWPPFHVTDDAVSALAASPLVARLASLDLKKNLLGPAAALALASSPHLTQLTRLNLSGNRIGDEGARALAGARHLAWLTELHLRNNNIKAGGARALVASPLPARLRFLDLRETKPLEDAGVVLLVCSGAPSLQTRLDLREQHIGPEGARALAESPHVSQVTWLDLSDNPVEDAGARALAASPYLGQLTHLHLEHARITDAGAEALASSQRLSALEHLNLEGNLIGPAGTQALAERFDLEPWDF